MVALSTEDQSRALFHTGMSGITGIPQQDLNRLIEAVTKIPDTATALRIVQRLTICDLAYGQTDMSDEPSSYKSLTIGDVNRTENRFNLKDFKLWWEVYLQQTDALCQMLWVANYWRADVARYRFERFAEVLVDVPGNLVKDTSIGATVYLLDSFSGGAGF